MLEPASVLAAIGNFFAGTGSSRAATARRRLLEPALRGAATGFAESYNQQCAVLRPTEGWRGREVFLLEPCVDFAASSIFFAGTGDGTSMNRGAASLIFAGTGNVDIYIRQFFLLLPLMDENDGGAASTFVPTTRYDGGELQPAKTESYDRERDAEGCGVQRERLLFFSPRDVRRMTKRGPQICVDRAVTHAHIGRLATDRPKVGPVCRRLSVPYIFPAYIWLELKNSSMFRSAEKKK